MKSEFRKVGVLMGGPSAEREVSLRSGAAISRGLRAAGYEVVELDVLERRIEVPRDVQAVFIALHGEFGEDGTVQALLEEQGIPYTGPGPQSSRMAFDKRLSKEVFLANAIPTPEYEVLTRPENRALPLPVVVKPPLQGSSIGIALVFDENDWIPAFEEAISHGEDVLVEAYVEGRELTVAILDGQILPVVEIKAPCGNYDYHAKYTSGKTEYLVPAPVSSEIAGRAGEIALNVFRALDARGLGRVDFRLAGDGALYVLELNTIPGFTETSLFPKAAQAAGVDFPVLCDRIMRTAMLP